MTESLSYPLIRRAIAETPWAILPDKLADIMAVVAYRASGGTISDDEIQAVVGAFRDRPRPQSSGDIAVLPLMGTISHRMGLLAQSSGGTSVEAWGKSFRALVADPSIGGIVIDVDSPGGSVSGIDEITSEIHRARGTKPITAVANTLMASAAYWIGSAADEVVVSPSAQVGSIGVIAAHEDKSGLYEKMGVKVSLISAGKYKAENNPFEPMTDEGKAAIQKRVDESYGMFTRAVARNRGVTVEQVRANFGEGRLVSAREAVRLGMADRVATIDDVISGMSRRLSAPVAVAASPQLTFDAHAETVLTAVEGLHARIAALTALRAGRRSPVAEDNVPRLEAHADVYEAIAREYRALVAQARQTASAPAEADRLLLDFLALEARRLGVPI